MKTADGLEDTPGDGSDWVGAGVGPAGVAINVGVEFGAVGLPAGLAVGSGIGPVAQPASKRAASRARITTTAYQGA